MTLLVSINNLKVFNMNITAKNILMETIIRTDGAYAPATIRAYKSRGSLNFAIKKRQQHYLQTMKMFQAI